MDPTIEAEIRASIEVKERFVAEGGDALAAMLATCRQALDAGNKLLLCGNGGSSCDAAHAAGELVGWFLEKERGPIAAIALGHQVPTLTAVANDSGYEQVFVRELEAIGKPGDVLIGISTSGTSKNVLAALRRAKELGIGTIAWTGESRGGCGEVADVWVPAPSTSTPRIQECHLLFVHLLCAELERAS